MDLYSCFVGNKLLAKLGNFSMFSFDRIELIDVALINLFRIL